MEIIRVQSTLTLEDWRALNMALMQRLQQDSRPRSPLARLLPVLGWLGVVAAMVAMFSTHPPMIRPMGAVILIALLVGTWWSFARLKARALEPTDGGIFLGEQLFEFAATGFRARRSRSDTHNEWSLVTEITETGEHVFLWIDRLAAYVLPGRDLPAGMTVAALAARLRELKAGAAAAVGREQGGDSVAQDPPAAPTAAVAPVTVGVVPQPSVWQELGALARLFGFAPVESASLYGKELTLALLGACALALWIGLDWLEFSEPVEFAWWALPGVAVLFVATMLLAWLLARFSRPRLALRQGMLLVLGLAPLFAVASWIIDQWPIRPVFVLAGILAAEAVLYLWRGLRSLSGRRQWPAWSLAVGVAGALVYFGSQQLFLVGGLWYAPESDDGQSAQASRAIEQLVFEQASIVDARVSALQPRVAGQANVFFVGFAGYGAQRVFAQEIELAARTVGQRYGAQGRTLQLVNDARDASRHPFATAASLRHALMGVASRMNLDQDLLFLAISSHGSEDATVSVESEYGYWEDLSADALAVMLRESKIRWKVIVISACHSGSFIDALRDEGTIILTAAAADRTSFGCSDDSELTYFGEALYQDALPGAASLREAFMEARAKIGEREQREGLRSSDPQGFFGSAIAAQIATLEPAAAPPPAR